MKKIILIMVALAGIATGTWAQTNITVAEALEIGATLGTDEVTTVTYTITGYVNVIDKNDFNTSYNNMTFWIADTQGRASSNAAGALQVYRGRPDVELQEGDKVSVSAKLKNYKGKTIETDPNNAPVTLIERGEPEPPQDTIQGTLRVCAQNLENYYYNYNTGRGDYTPAQFADKTRKIVNMMVDVNADIYAFCEVEAQPIVLAQLADSANSRVEGTPYTAVADGISEEWNEQYDNNLKSGFIYRKDRVKPVGANTGATYGNGYYAHTMRIQAFEQLGNGERLVVSMNHFKAKTGGGDQGEAQRQTNANNLVNALSKVTTDPDILILGDLNCEYGEAPITTIVNAGYEEQLLRFDSYAYSHCYGGGELIDHVLANESMAEQILDAYVKHVTTYKCTSGITQAMSYSDHDPYVVEISLGGISGECEPFSGTYLETGGEEYILGEMSQVSVSGQYYWRYQSNFGATCQDVGGEDWLLTPTYNFTQAKSVKVAFDHAINGANDMSTQQTLWVTKSLNSIDETEWQQLTIPSYPTGTDWKYVHTEVNVPIEYVGANTAFGFKYAVPSGISSQPKWEIKNLKVSTSCTEDPTNTEGLTTDKTMPQAQKVLIDGQLYLMYKGAMYDVRGRRVN